MCYTLSMDYQKLANEIMADMDLPQVRVLQGWNKHCSMAYCRQRKIWLNYGYKTWKPIIQIAEIIHECCHFMHETGYLKHGVEFKEYETYYLDKYGFEPIGYKRAYYYKIKDKKTGIIYDN